jgi:nicotinamide-nucleotide amidase
MEESSELESLAKQVISRLSEMKFTISLAESCTGGLAAHNLTNVRGASKIVLLSAVVYTAQAKNEILNVPWDVINEYGTVSVETTKHLLKGLKEKMNSNIEVAYTGVTDQVLEGKHSGFVIIGIQTENGMRIEEKTFSGDRLLVKKQAVIESFKMILEELDKI